jgi:hypothetical protein
MSTTDTSLRKSGKQCQHQGALGKVLPKTFWLQGRGELTLGSGVCGPVSFQLVGERHDFRAIGHVTGDDELMYQAWDEYCRLDQTKDSVRLILGGGLKIELRLIGYNKVLHALIVDSKSPSGHELSFEG